jgi:hypothetical protein
MEEEEDEDLMRGVKVYETDWKQHDSCCLWFKRYCVFNMGGGVLLFNGKVLGIEEWMGPRAEYWRHLADVVAHKQLRRFLDGLNDIGPNTLLARPHDCLPINFERLE